MRRTLIAATGFMLLVFAAGCGILPVRYERTFTHTDAWEGYQRVAVRTQNGRVTLAPGPVDQIRIDGKLRADLITSGDADKYLDQIEIVMRTEQQDPSTFIVELKIPFALRNKSVGADFDIVVPTACAADIKTSNGPIRVKNLKGPVVLDSSNGGIFAEQIAGELHALTSNGSIEVRSVAGNVIADTSNGKIVVTGVEGDCDLKTANGDIDVRELAGGVRAQSSNGEIHVQARPEATDQVVLSTSNGEITAELTATIRGEIDVDVDNGGLIVDTGPASLARLHHAEDRFQAELNGGGIGCIRAGNSNGSIRIICR